VSGCVLRSALVHWMGAMKASWVGDEGVLSDETSDRGLQASR
jgi:hypothetical protein